MESIAGLGTTAELEFKVSIKEVNFATSEHQLDFHPYNPRKTNDHRSGLSLTSLDGGLSGVPDLDSLREYNLLHGTELTESSFKIRTPVVEKISGIADIMRAFEPFVARSHLIRFDRGGFFPPHRDGYPGEHSHFRIFSLLSHSMAPEYNFVLNGKLETFFPGSTYFIDTQVVHSFVSFVDNLTILVVNIEDTPESRRILYRHLAVK